MYSLLNILQCHSKVVFEAFCKVDVKGVSIQADGFWRAENSGAFLDLFSSFCHVIRINKAAIHWNELCELKLWEFLYNGGKNALFGSWIVSHFLHLVGMATNYYHMCFSFQISALVLDEGQPTIRGINNRLLTFYKLSTEDNDGW